MPTCGSDQPLDCEMAEAPLGAPTFTVWSNSKTDPTAFKAITGPTRFESVTLKIPAQPSETCRATLRAIGGISGSGKFKMSFKSLTRHRSPERQAVPLESLFLMLHSFVGRVSRPVFFNVVLVGPEDPTYGTPGEFAFA